MLLLAVPLLLCSVVQPAPSVQDSTPTAELATSASPLHGRLLFTRQVRGRDDLCVLHLPEGRVEALTDHRAKDSHGVPSSDGARIVFNSERVGWWKIWLMQSDGTEIEQLTRPRSGADYHPAWGPKGRILYVAGSEGSGDIMSLGLDGGAALNLTNHPARDNFPTWSAVAGRIAFASDREERWSIWVMGPDGGDVRRVTDLGDALEPAWFPDGQRLVYQAAAEDEQAFHLWSVPFSEGASAGTATQLTAGASSDERPCVSPDGAWIVFESNRAGGSHLFALSSAGGEPRQLTHAGYCYGAAWFPAAGR